MSDIFISYKREEQPIARKLADALEREGWSVWWDPNLRAGEHFDDAIEKALKESKCAVVMWSKLAVNSRYVKDEATYALNRRKLVPVAIEHVELPFRFEGIHTPLLVGWDGSHDFPEFKKLVDDITAIIGEPARKASDIRVHQSRAKVPGTEIPLSTAKSPRERNVNWLTRTKAPLAPEPSITSITIAKCKPGTIFRDALEDGSRGPEMVVIPAGSFQMGDMHGMGDKSEKPVHTVHIQKPFAIGRYQITFDEYDNYVKHKQALSGLVSKILKRPDNVTRSPLPNDHGWGRGMRPVIEVSWDEAGKYAKWLSEQTGKSYRLPTEAEWEYAARSGGNDEIWAGTSDEKQLAEYAIFRKDRTERVGSRKANGLGLHDMSGNVCEYVRDCWHENYKAAPTDGSAWLREDLRERVIRGGSWRDYPVALRASSRDCVIAYFYSQVGGTRSHFIGFRLVQDSD